MERKLKSATAKARRAKNTCKKLILKTKEQNLLSAESEQKLQQYKDVPSHLFTKSSKGYTDEQQKFVLTLHLYSPKAYEYLRK